ncbi:MAG: hypothetical protein AAF471_06930 [Myxococcota bacterium]
MTVPLWAGILGYFSSIRSFLIAAGAGVATVGAWKLGLGQFIPIGATVPAMAANLIAFIIAKHFDKPEDIYYEPDDPFAQMVKEKALKRAERKPFKSVVAEFRASFARLGVGCKQWIVGWLHPWRRFVWFCCVRAQLFMCCPMWSLLC